MPKNKKDKIGNFTFFSLFDPSFGFFVPSMEGSISGSKIQTSDITKDDWYYIVENSVAPLFEGEWGGPASGELLTWLNAIREFKHDIKLYHTFWWFNPNSGETIDLVSGGWKILDQTKYNIVEQLLWKDNAGGYISHNYEDGLNAYLTNIIELIAN